MQTETSRRATHGIRLASALAWNAIVTRNERSLLGVVWYLLNPVLLFLVMYGIHVHTPLASVPEYGFYLASGLLCYSMFRGITMTVSRSFVSSAALIRNVNVPRFSLCLARLVEALFAHAVEIVMLLAIAAWFGIFANVFAYLIPLLAFIPFAFSAGYLLAVAAVHLNDIQNIWNFAMMALIFLSPIFYFIPAAQEPWFVRYNPVTVFVDASRAALLEGTLIWEKIGVMALSSALALGIAYLIHRSRFGREIAENI
jgi:ABC-type polysaccharide/polyol phosphate export permease